MKPVKHFTRNPPQASDKLTDLTEQVYLLALKATIEAARAGYTGKGFAVVGYEIKDLAKQSAATHEIASDVAQAVKALPW